MFTGIITAIGNIAAVHPTAGGARIRVAAPGLGLTDGQVGRKYRGQWRVPDRDCDFGRWF